MTNHLSPAQVAAYRRDGYVHPLSCLTTAETRSYRAVIEDYERESGEQATLIIRNKGHLKLRALYDLIELNRCRGRGAGLLA